MSFAVSLLKSRLLKIPAIRSLHEARNALLAQRDALSTELDACRKRLASNTQDVASPFYHYNTSFDAQAVIRRHAIPGLSPHPKYRHLYISVT